jgi:hypothetical protein
MYLINQYMVIIKPGERVKNRMRRIRETWKQQYNLLPSQMQGGFILLTRFWQYKHLEQKVLDRLHLIAMDTAPFKVHLKDYAFLPQESIGLQIENPAGIYHIVKKMQRDPRPFKTPQHHPYFNLQPKALWLAKKLLPQQFDQIAATLRKRHFTADFIADSLMVLRKAGNDSRWIVAGEYPLQNFAVLSEQGVLFAP